MGIDSILNWFKLAPEDEDYDDDFADGSGSVPCVEKGIERSWFEHGCRR